MNAKRYTVDLFWRSTRQSRTDTNLDPRDDAKLRSLLEQLVEAKHGSLNTDLSTWWIRVHNLGGGQVQAECRVSKSGDTDVKR